MKSRDKFVKQVANNIRRNHASEKEASFIFGISGKWGEGKTTFLKDLEIELSQNGEFRIVWVSPWKYGDDKIALLRNFLLAIKPGIKINKFLSARWSKLSIKESKIEESVTNEKYDFLSDLKILFRKVRRGINDKDFSQELLFDRNKVTVHLGMVFLYVLAMMNILVWFILLKDQLPVMYPRRYVEVLGEILGFYESNKNILNILFISGLLPTIYAIARGLLTTQSGSKSAYTVDQFDKLLDCAIKDGDGNKLIVFVDDLDRVTPEIARNVLDNLRVFFNRSDISFVVAGDHTVLERYIGDQTLPYGKPNEQLEEGRRYLKKIFNVYWRLPLPIKSEFQSALKKLMSENQRDTKLKAIFLKRGQYKQFISILESYFDRNFRAIERFAENVIFTFEVIDIQIEGEESEYLHELKNFPLLVVRTLLIQEFCAPLFEKISRNVEILEQLEKAAYKKDKEHFNKSIEEHGYELTDNQKELLAKILFDNHGFYNSEGNFLVKAYQPFVSLAADSSFGDIRGPLPEEFVNIIASGDSERIKNALIDGGIEKLTNAAKSAVENLNSQASETTQFIAKSSALINALLSLEKDHRSQNIFMNAITLLQIKTAAQKITPPEERINFYMIFWKWLDFLDKYDDKWLDMFPLVGNDELSLIQIEKDKKAFGKFSSRVIGRWFTQIYKSQKTQALEKIASFVDALVKEEFRLEIESVSDTLVDDFISDQSEVNRNTRLKIVEKFLDEQHREKVVNHIYSRIDIQDESDTTWSMSVANSTSLWSFDDIQTRIVNLLNTCSSENEVIDLLTFCRGKLTSQKSTFWDKVLNEKVPLFVNTIPHIHSDENFRPFAPPESTALQLFKMIVEKVRNFEDIDNKLNWLGFLVRQKWLWDTLGAMPAGRSLSGMARSSDDRIKQKISEIKGSWGV